MRFINQFQKYGVLAGILLLCITSVTAQDNQSTTEYHVVLELKPGDLTEGVQDGWRVAVGTALPDSEIVDSSLWQVEEEVPGISLTPQDQIISLWSPVLSLDNSCAALSGVILGTGANKVEVQLHWLSRGAVVDTTVLNEPAISNEIKRRFNLAESKRPPNADAAQLLLRVHPENTNTSFCCTTANLTGTFSFVQSAALFCNKIGYDQIGPKMFTVRANFMAQQARFAIHDALKKCVFRGELSAAKRIQGIAGAEWEGYYYKGDFSYFEEEGEYTLLVELDSCEPIHKPIRIAFNLLWEAAFAPALAPFKQLRISPENKTDQLQLWDPNFMGEA
ncbi:MAG: hypothetical protein KAH38_11535, partial [Candidatus Hydrogenedentes bacterium]|nr:hypothetical protein [Candidatus Hydrogenedentota bacterium]